MGGPSLQHSTTPSPQSSRSAWLRLLRVPNLLTVPGDPLAGYLLAAGAGADVSWNLAAVLAVALLLYAAGLVLNDLADREVDARERPNRPLPSGAIRSSTARVAAGLALVVAVGLSAGLERTAFAATLALLSAILLYNFALKSTALGPACMGVCRGLSLLLGAAIVKDGLLPWAVAAALAIYVAVVTLVARREMAGAVPFAWTLQPALAVLVNLVVLTRAGGAAPAEQGRLGTVLFLAFALAGLGAWRLHASGPRAAPEIISLWISVLIVLQAAYCLAAGAGALGLLAALLLLLLWPVNRLLAARIAGS